MVCGGVVCVVCVFLGGGYCYGNGVFGLVVGCIFVYIVCIG